MGRPSDHTEALCQNLTNDLMELVRITQLEPAQHEVVRRMLNRIEAFDHTFGRPIDPLEDAADDD